MLSHVFISRLLLTEVDNGFYSLYNGSWRVEMRLLSKFEVLTVICRRNIFNEST